MRPHAALLADIGGTRARFALLRPGEERPSASVELASADFRDLESAARGALEELCADEPGAPEVREAAVAVAAPVLGDRVELTNVDWTFSIEATRRALDLGRLEVVNDVAAVAHALPGLGPSDWRALHSGRTGATGPRAVLSIGTGLGMALEVSPGVSFEPLVLSTEGGHRDLAAASELEWRIVERLSERFSGHVSVERAVSGEGIGALYGCLSELVEASPEVLPPAEIGRRALAGEPRAVEALALWSGWLGAVAGDAALTCGATGGVWIAGGVVPRLGAAFDEARFRERFLAKGRFRSWLERVPVRLLVAPDAAFRGLARRLASAR
ncbi:MAG TPA: glucokinase [Thermoanaerobaculia bacterium]|nr:glucokinase [Thermoanaerobaculia bacterium]